MSFWKEWMIHVNLPTQLHERLAISKSFRGDGQMELDRVNASQFEVKGQLTVTDRFTVHEDQIIEIWCSKNPRRTRLWGHN